MKLKAQKFNAESSIKHSTAYFDWQRGDRAYGLLLLDCLANFPTQITSPCGIGIDVLL